MSITCQIDSQQHELLVVSAESCKGHHALWFTLLYTSMTLLLSTLTHYTSINTEKIDRNK